MPTKRETWKVTEKEAQSRLDRFLLSHFPDVSRAFLQHIIESGAVAVNDKAVRKGFVLSEGDTVSVEPFLMPDERRILPNPNVPLEVVFESKEVLVINKQAGLPTHPNEFMDQDTLANAVLAQYPEIGNVGEDHLRPGIVHRLDTNTSGLIMVARTQSAFTFLRNLFDERKVKKTYTALVLGELKSAGEVALPIAHHPTNPRRMVVVKEGVEVRSRIREAKTIYKPVEKFKGYTLLEVKTLTGRMHQVRVHLSGIGHSLVGDKVYQSKKEQTQDKTGLKRHFLHASELIVTLPGEKSARTFTSAIPEELSALLTVFRLES